MPQAVSMEKEMKVIIDNWMVFHPVVTNVELGWNEECIRDAKSVSNYGIRLLMFLKEVKEIKIWAAAWNNNLFM